MPIGAFGICIVNGEAFDAGVASIPTPWTESFDDRWFFHQYWIADFILQGSGTEKAPQQDFFNRQIDGKAMRKVEDGDVMVSVMENGSSVGARAFVNFRTLIKLV